MTDTVIRASERFAQFRREQGPAAKPTARIRFHGVEGFDVYNITAPFSSAGRTVIAGRVEKRDSEHAQARFFEERDGAWHLIADAPTFQLQDPFFTRIGGELVFGGVEIHELEGRLGWRTVFYRGADIFTLKHFFNGPDGMKDIRLVQLQDGRLGVFTRPQGAKGGRGTIGYAEADGLDGLNTALIDSAPLLAGMFHPLDWGGANETHLLANGEIGVLSHVAYFENDDTSSNRHYFASTFVFDPRRRQFRDFKIIGCRDQFTPGAAKRPDLVDVVFSSGLVFADGKTRLYAGTSDAEAHWLEIANPFA